MACPRVRCFLGFESEVRRKFGIPKFNYEEHRSVKIDLSKTSGAV